MKAVPTTPDPNTSANRDTNGRHIVIQIGGVYIYIYILLSAMRRAYFCKSIAIEMGGVSRYFFTCIGVRGRFDSPELSALLVKAGVSSFCELCVSV